jgi:histidinol-phosphate aminotransferase
VNALALAAASASLECPEHVVATRALALDGKRALVPALARLGATVVPSQANFLLVRLPEVPGVEDVCAALASRAVDVFDLTRLGFGMERGWARVTIGHPEEHARLLEALETIVGARAAERPAGP